MSSIRASPAYIIIIIIIGLYFTLMKEAADKNVAHITHITGAVHTTESQGWLLFEKINNEINSLQFYYTLLARPLPPQNCCPDSRVWSASCRRTYEKLQTNNSAVIDLCEIDCVEFVLSLAIWIFMSVVYRAAS